MEEVKEVKVKIVKFRSKANVLAHYPEQQKRKGE
jgi:hypothetical protein